MAHYSKTGILLLGFLVTASLGKAQDNIVLKNGSEIKVKVLEVSPTEIKYRRQDNPDGPVYTTGARDILLIQYANGTKDVLNPAPATRSQPDSQLRDRMNGGRPSEAEPTNRRPGGLERLRYQGGVFNRHFQAEPGGRLSRQDVHTMMLNRAETMQTFRQGQSLRRWAYITGGTAIALIGTGAALSIADHFGNDGQGNRRDNDNDHNTTTSTTSRNEHDRRDGAVVGYALAGGGVLLGVTALMLNHKATIQFRRAASRYNDRPATSLQLIPGFRGTGMGLSLQF